MQSIRGMREVMQTQRVWNKDKIFFEMHKLASERNRLEKLRSSLVRRFNNIDQRLEEIAATLEYLNRQI